MIRQSEYLAEHGIQCTFLVPRPSAPWPLYKLPRWHEYGPANTLLTDPNHATHSFRYFRPPGGWFKQYEGKAIAKAMLPVAKRLHAEERYSAILSCPMIRGSASATIVNRELGLPHVTLSIGSDVLVYPRQWPKLELQLRESIKHASLSVGVSQAICRRLSELGADNPLCVYLGRDASRFTPAADRKALRAKHGWSDEHIVAVTVGRLVKTKGTRELIDASRSLFQKHPNFRIVIVGTGPDRDGIEAFANEPAHAERVKLAGELLPEQVPEYLQAADFLALPSYSEGMPQAVLEAMNCGLPVVATRVGGVPEAVLDGQNGLLIEPRDREQLEQAMQQLITDGPFRKQAGQRSLQIVTEVFDSAKNAARLANAIKNLVSTS